MTTENPLNAIYAQADETVRRARAYPELVEALKRLAAERAWPIRAHHITGMTVCTYCEQEISEHPDDCPLAEARSLLSRLEGDTKDA